jgi:phosphatidylserine decarboxylase
MNRLLNELRVIVNNPVVESAFNDAIANVEPYVAELGTSQKNPWAGKTVDYFVDYFENWFTFLPTPTGGLGKIVPFTFFYLNNREAFYFLNDLKSRRKGAKSYTREVFNWTVKFVKARGRFMDSPESLKYLPEWKQSLGPTIKDFIIPKGGFTSFNEFFTRELKPSAHARPISDPQDESVLVASADSEVNFIQADLTLSTSLKVKTRQISVKDLLKGSKYAKQFVGGTAVSCVLMPNSYHRYHAPVGGMIVESQDVPGIYNGVMDGEHWFNEGNIGEGTTDFSIFEDFHRAYFVIRTTKHGYVAMVPVGLNTISAIFASVVNRRSTMVPVGGRPVRVAKGDELGHFAYGGSLNILLFQPGVFSSVSVRMGQRLGSLSTP